MPTELFGDNFYFFRAFPQAVQDNPSQYIKANSNEFKKFLQEIRSAGKVVFICTNSHADYAVHVLNTCLQDTNWHQYIDFLLCDAEKPKFFTAQQNHSLVDKFIELKFKTKTSFGRMNFMQFQGINMERFLLPTLDISVLTTTFSLVLQKANTRYH